MKKIILFFVVMMSLSLFIAQHAQAEALSEAQINQAIAKLNQQMAVDGYVPAGKPQELKSQNVLKLKYAKEGVPYNNVEGLKSRYIALGDPKPPPGMYDTLIAGAPYAAAALAAAVVVIVVVCTTLDVAYVKETNSKFRPVCVDGVQGKYTYYET